MTTGRCPYCASLGTGEPCNPACPPQAPGGGHAMLQDGIRSTDAHAKKHHPIDQAHTPTQAVSSARVYVICGWQGCPPRRQDDAPPWRMGEGRWLLPLRPQTPHEEEPHA